MPSTIISAASAASSRPMTFKLSTDPMFVRKVRDIVSRNRGVSVEFHAILTRLFHPILTHPVSSPVGSRCG